MTNKKTAVFSSVLAVIMLLLLAVTLLTSQGVSKQNEPAIQPQENPVSGEKEENDDNKENEVNDDKNSDQLLLSSTYALGVEEESITPTGATFILTNNSNHEIMYGEAYHLRQERNGEWMDVPYVIDNWGFIDEGFILASKDSVELSVDWEWLYGALPTGTYCFDKGILLPKSDGTYEDITLTVSFQIL